jgi:hypothetical protein
MSSGPRLSSLENKKGRQSPPPDSLSLSIS